MTTLLRRTREGGFLYWLYPRTVRLFSLRPLRRRDFALLWSAALVSNVGTWMQTVAVGVLVTARTHQAGWTGLVAAAAFVPIGLLSPVGGAMADRFDRRRWLLVTTAGETAFATGLAVLAATGQARPGVVALVVLGGGIMGAVGFPAYQAMLPDLVETKDLLAAISLSSAQFNLGRVIGPALAGVAIVAGSYSLAFALNAGSFLAVLAALVLVRPQAPARLPEPTSLRRRLVEGARVAAAEPGCRAAIVLIAVVALLASPFIALVPAVALKLFHQQASGTSVLVTAQGVGAVLGALALASLVARWGRRRVVVTVLVALPVVLVGYAAAPTLDLAAVALLAVGAVYIGVLSGLNSAIQLRVPAEARGRVLGLYMMALGTIYPLGALVQGFLGDQLGLRRVTIGAAALLLVAMTVFVWRWPDLVAALDDPTPAAAGLVAAGAAPAPVAVPGPSPPNPEATPVT